jgi:hypothetical protein
MLRDILQKHLSELTFEIAFSDRKDSVEFLKRRKEFIEGFIQRLERELASGRKEEISIDQSQKSGSFVGT